MSTSWALFIMIMLLMFALFTSYILQQKKIQAVHETVLSIFAGRPYSTGTRALSGHIQSSIVPVRTAQMDFKMLTVARDVRWIDHSFDAQIYPPR
jgi:NhaP-type Na+/H+ or K+/H+ antiporter